LGALSGPLFFGENKMTRFNSMSINKATGKTYWHTSFESIEEVKAHCNRYVKKPSDILIYDVSKDAIKFVEIWEDFK
jgi:hypothetical protein